MVNAVGSSRGTEEVVEDERLLRRRDNIVSNEINRHVLSVGVQEQEQGIYRHFHCESSTLDGVC